MLIEHIARQLTHGQDRPGMTFQQNVQALVDYHGSGRAAARALQVPESTLRGWRKGTIPKSTDRIRDLQVSARVTRVDTTLLGRIGHGDPDFLLTVRGLIRYSDDERVRTIVPGKEIPVHIVVGAVRQWLYGNDDAADRTLLDAIDTYYWPFSYPRVEWAGFGSPAR